MTTLRALLAAHPTRFYPQSWYGGQPFLDTPLPDDAPVHTPTRMMNIGQVPPKLAPGLPLAVTLANIYLRRPFDPIWSRYFWCADTDALGQRVYVGGVRHENDGRFEIHRHLAITDRWGRASWD